MRSKTALLVMALAATGYGDSYNALVQRYEVQIHQQERQLTTLRRSLQEKEQEAKRWQQKAEAAKEQWTEAGLAVENARKQVRMKQERRTKVRAQAEAASWTAAEHATMEKSANAHLTFWTIERSKQLRTPRYFSDLSVSSYNPELVVEQLAALAQVTQILAENAQRHETELRLEEMKWQTEEQKQAMALDKNRHTQQNYWLRWQEAQQRRQMLENERVQLEQSAQALRVMLTELREHRDDTLAAHTNAPRRSAALTSLKGTIPWPASGSITQDFGKHYSEKLQQLIISNGIRLQTEPGKPVRAVQPGKVLFARPFQQYGQLVIVQHQHGLTSVYGELGQTQVKEGDMVTVLDPIGTVGQNRSFYFELRRDEEPINPLAWLAPLNRSELTSRRKDQ